MSSRRGKALLRPAPRDTIGRWSGERRAPAPALRSIARRRSPTSGAPVSARSFTRLRGLPLVKFAEDLRTYERLLWSARVDVVIEIGTFVGGSALWFRDRLRAMRAIATPAARW